MKNLNNTNITSENAEKELHIDDLFEKLKNEMVEYCSYSDDITLEQQIQYYIDEFKRYNHRRKEWF